MLTRIATHLTNRLKSDIPTHIPQSNIRSKSGLSTKNSGQHQTNTTNLLSTSKAISSLSFDIQKSFSPLTFKREIVSQTGPMPYSMNYKTHLMDLLNREDLLGTVSTPLSVALTQKLAAITDEDARHFVPIAKDLKTLGLNKPENLEDIFDIHNLAAKKDQFYILKYLRSFFEVRAQIEKKVTPKEYKWMVKFLKVCTDTSKAMSSIQDDIHTLYFDILNHGYTEKNFHRIQNMMTPTSYSELVATLKQFYPQELQTYLAWHKIEGKDISDLCLPIAKNNIEPVLGILRTLDQMKLLNSANAEMILKLNAKVPVWPSCKDNAFEVLKKLLIERQSIAKSFIKPMTQKELDLVMHIITNFPPKLFKSYWEMEALYKEVALKGWNYESSTDLKELSDKAQHFPRFKEVAKLFTEAFPLEKKRCKDIPPNNDDNDNNYYIPPTLSLR